MKKIVIVLIISSLLMLTHGGTSFGGTLTDGAPTQGKKASPRYVSIDFNGVDIRLFIKFISDLTQVNFVVDDKVKGKVSIISPREIPVEQAYKVFESVMEVHGYTTVKSGNITKIVPIPSARTKNVDTLIQPGQTRAEDKIVTQLIPFRYADVLDIQKLFTPFISKGSVILAYPPTNTLIVTDFLSNIHRLVKIFRAIDVKDVGRQLSFIPIEHADAQKMIKKLTALFKKAVRVQGKKTGGEGVAQFVADERTNMVIVLANEFDTLKIKKFISVLDQEVPRSDAKFNVVYLENAKAEELAKVLQSSTGPVKKKVKGKTKAPVVSGLIKITADKATNSLIIMADKDDFMILKGIIQKLDIARPMVYIEAVIMEVRVEDNLNLGVEWTVAGTAGEIHDSPGVVYGGYSGDRSALPTITDGAVTLPGGFSLGLLGKGITVGGITFPTVGMAVNALQKNEKVNILSTPQIMTTDNEEARILVGENVPYITRKETSTTDSDREYESYEYKDVGVTLKITPQISQERFVTLNIFQEVIKVADDSIQFRPTTLKRIAETTVVVKDAETVVIGGLIGEDLSNTVSQVPCLGDVPLLGNLFKSSGNSGIKTNLYIFLTPHIVANPAEAKKIYTKKKGEIKKVKEETIRMYKGGTEPGKTPSTDPQDQEN